MKRLIYAVVTLLFAIFITGCSEREELPNDNVYHPEVDFPYMYGDGLYGLEVASSPNGYYLLHDNLIYYLDKDTMQPVILDNRPDHGCDHQPNSENCYAYVEQSATGLKFIQYYNSHLYIAETLFDPQISKAGWYMKLSRIDLDGKNRKEVKTFPIRPKSLAIHRGYIYYAIVSVSKENEEKLEIFRSSIQKPNEEELIYSGEADGIEDISPMTLTPFGNQIYWVGIGSQGYLTQRYDLSTGEVIRLWDRGDGSSSSLLAISDGRLYFSYFYGDPTDPRTLVKYSSNLAGDDIQEEISIDQHPPVISYLLKDQNYTYIRPVYGYADLLPQDIPYELAIYKDGKKIHALDLTPLTNFFDVYVGDERYMFVSYDDNTKSGFYYIDKQKFETQEAAFIPLLETVRTE